jgi:hypothetical protein
VRETRGGLHGSTIQIQCVQGFVTGAVDRLGWIAAASGASARGSSGAQVHLAVANTLEAPCLAHSCGVDPVSLHDLRARGSMNLSLADHRALPAQASLRTYLKAAKYILRSNLPDRLGIILADAGQVEEEHLKVILTYLDKGPIKVDIKLLRETLLRLVPDKKERIMGWFSQPYYDQGPCRLTTDMSQPQHQ